MEHRRVGSAVSLLIMKAKPPKEIRDRREQPPSSKTHILQSTERFDWKFWVGLGIAIAGLILGAIGLNLAIEARPTISLETPLNPDDVLTTPFVISNDGALSLENVTAAILVRNFEDTHGNHIGGLVGWGSVPTSPEMRPSDRKTIQPFSHIVNEENPIISGEVAIVVSYTPAYIPLWPKHRGFRFVVERQSDGRSRFEQQPSEGIEEDYLKRVKGFNVH